MSTRRRGRGAAADMVPAPRGTDIGEEPRKWSRRARASSEKVRASGDPQRYDCAAARGQRRAGAHSWHLSCRSRGRAGHASSRKGRDGPVVDERARRDRHVAISASRARSQGAQRGPLALDRTWSATAPPPRNRAQSRSSSPRASGSRAHRRETAPRLGEQARTGRTNAERAVGEPYRAGGRAAAFCHHDARRREPVDPGERRPARRAAGSEVDGAARRGAGEINGVQSTHRPLRAGREEFSTTSTECVRLARGVRYGFGGRYARILPPHAERNRTGAARIHIHTPAVWMRGVSRQAHRRRHGRGQVDVFATATRSSAPSSARRAANEVGRGRAHQPTPTQRRRWGGSSCRPHPGRGVDDRGGPHLRDPGATSCGASSRAAEGPLG